MLKRIILLFIIIKGSSLFSQEFKIVNIDVSKFPEVSAIYEAIDATGKTIYNAKNIEFGIKENYKEILPYQVINPSIGAIPLSVALILDNSGSMADNSRLDFAKKGIAKFLNKFPFEKSEIALESFSDNIQVLTDYTQSYDRTLFTLGTVRPLSGTNYNKAFLISTIGAFDLTDRAQFKKIIIFITDGLSNINKNEVLAKARVKGVPVYTCLLELAAPPDLDSVAVSSGGECFEQITSDQMLATTLNNIIQKTQVSKFGKISWLSLNNCAKQKKLNINFRGKQIDTTYIVPEGKQANLEVNPRIVSFGYILPGTTKDASIDIVPHNGSITLSALNTTKTKNFSVLDKSILFTPLLPDSLYKITIRYQSNDNIKLIDNLTISSNECPDKTVKLYAGSDEQIQIICPAGGEVFVPGMDSSIQWDGTLKNRKVKIWFRTSPEAEWKIIGNGQNWYFTWSIPKDTSGSCQIKLASGSFESMELHPAKLLLSDNSKIESIMFDNEGKYLVTSDDRGFVFVWDVMNGTKERSYGGFKFESATFYNNNSSLGLYSNDKLIVLTLNKLYSSASYTFINKKVLTSLCFDNGMEQLISAYSLADKTGMLRIWMPGTNKVFFLNELHDIKYASFTASYDYMATLDSQNKLQIWDVKKQTSLSDLTLSQWLDKVVISPSGNELAIVENGKISMYDIPNLKLLWEHTNMEYIKYFKSGLIMMTRNNKGIFFLLKVSDGSTLYSFTDYTSYHCSPTKYQVLHYANDTLRLFDGEKEKNIITLIDPGIKACSFSPDGSKILIVNGKNEIDFYSTSSNALTETLNEFDSQVLDAVFNPNNKGLAVIMSNGNIQLFSKGTMKPGKEAISNKFSIISPKPKVVDSILFTKQSVSESIEKMAHPFASNGSRFPIKVEKIEIINDADHSFAFSQLKFPLYIKPFDKISCEFTFVPKYQGICIALIRTITTTDTFYTVLKGEGIYNPLQILAQGVNFGKIKVLSSIDSFAPLITNTGIDTIILEHIDRVEKDSITFRFQTNHLPIKIPPGEKFYCKLSFHPQYRGLVTGLVDIKFQNRVVPERVVLSGEGVAPRYHYVVGTTRDISDSLPIVADLSCNDLITNREILYTLTDSLGRFEMKLNVDRNYSIIANKPDYLSSSENIDLTSKINPDTSHITLWLSKISNGSIVRFNCIFFDFAKATLQEISTNDLNRVTQLMKTNPSIQVEIHGHTDNIGTDENNMILSSKRSQSVKSYLLAKGIQSNRLSIKAFGERIPIEDNSSEAGRKANRRVEFKFVKAITK
jgi:outer membrane protein OmpA-like peptidoglycan-associated protein